MQAYAFELSASILVNCIYGTLEDNSKRRNSQRTDVRGLDSLYIGREYMGSLVLFVAL